MFTLQDVYYAVDNPKVLAEKLNKLAHVDVVAGKAGANVLVGLTNTVTEVKAILAIVTATGAFATKALLAPTTDYTFANGEITCVTDQSANTLIVIYK
jgi:hypothetical protein